MKAICILVTIVASSSIAAAGDPPLIAIGPPSNPETTLDEARVDVRTAGDVALVKLRIGLVSPSVDMPAARVSIAIPSNARVVGMELSQSNEAFTAEAMTTRDARGEFDEHRAWRVDPALLEWHGETADHRRVLLSMSPITKTPSTATVLLAIPDLQRLELDVAGSRRTIPQATFARATPAERAIAARQEFVTPEQSLYAGPIDPPATEAGVSRYVRAHYPDLILCDPGDNAHDAVLHFTIEHGHVHALSLEGAPEKSEGCIADLLDRWTFREFVNAVHIDFAVHFIAENEAYVLPFTR